MKIYSTQNYSGLKNLFGNQIPNSPLLYSVLEGKVKGFALCDDPDQPKSCLVTTSLKGLNTVFPSPFTYKKFLDRAIEQLKKQSDFQLVWDPQSQKKLMRPKNFDQEIPRMQFLQLRLWNKAYEKPFCEKCKVVPLNHSSYPLSLHHAHIEKYYGHFENFIRHGKSLCLMDGNRMTCEALILFCAHRQVELAVATQPDDRGKGYATWLCSQLIQDFMEQEFQIHYTCDANNKASVAVARKLGFGPNRSYQFLHFKKDSQISAQPDVRYSDQVPFSSGNKPVSFQGQMISNSMNPFLRQSDMIVAQKTDPEHLRRGDLVLIKQGNYLFCHRFLKRLDRQRYLTKGDGLDRADPPIQAHQLVAKVISFSKLKCLFNLKSKKWIQSNHLLGIIHHVKTAPKVKLWHVVIINILKTFLCWGNPFLKPIHLQEFIHRRLFIILSQLRINSHDKEMLNAYLDQVTDWFSFHRLFLYNHTEALALFNISQSNCEDKIPQWIVHDFEKKSLAQKQKRRQALRNLLSLFAQFEEKKLRVILLKGFVLSQTLYPEIDLRPMNDIDLLVKPEDWPQVKNIILGEGFRNTLNLDPLKLEKLAGIPLNWQVSFSNQTGTKIEIKFHLFALEFPDFSTSQYFWQTTRPMMIEDQQIHTLSPENQLLYMFSCLPKIRYRYLPWFHEIKEWMNKMKPDWDSFIDKTKETDMEIINYYGLKILKDHFNVDIPSEVLSCLKPSIIKRILFTLCFGKKDFGYRDPRKHKHSRDVLISNILLKGKLIQAVRFCRRLIFPPAAYFSYRYQIPKWQTFLGIGLLKRLRELTTRAIYTEKASRS